MIVSPTKDGPDVTVHFQNEYTVVAVSGNPRVTVPDLICVFDDVRGEPIGTEALRYRPAGPLSSAFPLRMPSGHPLHSRFSGREALASTLTT